jgi:replication factor A1
VLTVISVERHLSCRRKMSTQTLIEQILAKNPQISQTQLMERLAAERVRCGGLLSDETLLRLIAAKLGVEVSQNSIQNSGFLSISRLCAGLNDVSVVGRTVAVFPAKTFQGAEKSGKYASLMIVDKEGVLRVMLWNEKAELVEKGELKVDQTVRLLHGYTREDRGGKTELHLGSKSQVEIDPDAKASDYPPIEKFTTKISQLNPVLGNVHVLGTVKEVLGKKNFARNGSGEGTVLRLSLADDSGAVVAVVWNEKVAELEKTALPNTRLMLVNARVKEAQGGGVEVHVDSGTFVAGQPTKD